MNNINFLRRGSGSPLLLVHGLGGSWESWCPVLSSLADHRDVIAIDLPGFGRSPPMEKAVTVSSLADAVTDFLADRNLLGIDAVGSSVGARVLLELARRGSGVVGAVVALSPTGFWRGIERHAFFASMYASIRLVRKLQPMMTDIVHSRSARSALLAQLSAHPWRIPSQLVLTEMRNYANSESFDELLRNLAYGEEPKVVPFGSVSQPLVIGWGNQDRVCFPWEADRAMECFPDAKLHRFEQCGHFPHWDVPEETVQMILENTGNAVIRFGASPRANFPAQTVERAQSTRFDSPAL